MWTKMTLTSCGYICSLYCAHCFMYFIKVNNSHTKKEIITLMRKEQKDFFKICFLFRYEAEETRVHI